MQAGDAKAAVPGFFWLFDSCGESSGTPVPPPFSRLATMAAAAFPAYGAWRQLSQGREWPYVRPGMLGDALRLRRAGLPPADPSATSIAFLPLPPGDKMDLDFVSWSMAPNVLGNFALGWTLADWFWKISPLGHGRQTVQVTEPPFMVRLIDFGTGCEGVDGASQLDRTP